MPTPVLGSYSFTTTPNVNGTLVLLDTGTLVLDSITPTLPEPGSVTLYGKTLASRVFPAFVGPSGMDVATQPALWRQKVARWNPPGSATTVPGVDGMNAPTSVGTVTARAVASTNLFTRTKRLGYVSASNAGSRCGHYSTVGQFTTGDGNGLGGFFYSCRFGFSDTNTITGTRAFVGMTATTTAPSNVDPATLLNSMGVAQLSSSTSQLYFVYGGTSAQTAIPLGTNFPPMVASGATQGIAYDLTIFCPPNSNGVINYRLERIGTSYIAEGTITPSVYGTHTPNNTILLGHRAWRTNNYTSGIVAIDILGVYIETDF